jgi:uncharacterized membrane protein
MRKGSLVLSAAVLLACSASDDGDSDDAGAGTGDDASGPTDAGVDAAAECTVTAPAQCPDPPVRYEDVVPIFMERCVGCHAGMPGGPWALTDYGHVTAWFNEIRAAMLSCAMPPADAGIAMPDAEREEILTWIRCGFPR